MLTNRAFTLGPRHRAEIARVFGETLEQALESDGAVSRTEAAVKDYLESLAEREEEDTHPRPNADPALMDKHKKRARKLIAAIKMLQGLIDECSNLDDAIVDDIDFRSNIIGALALAGPTKRKRLPFGEDDSAELHAFLHSGEIGLASIKDHLGYLEAASSLYLDYCIRERGRRPDDTSYLITELYSVCYPWKSNGSREVEPPAATNSRLTRTVSIVLEALGRPVPQSIEKKIRRALAAEASYEARVDEWYNRVQGFSDQK